MLISQEQDSAYSPGKLIDEYYEVYIVRVIELLKKQFSDQEIIDILTQSLTQSAEQFSKYLDNSIKCSNRNHAEAEKILAFYSVLRRMITGNLTTEDSLMSSLLKAFPEKTINELNNLVKEKITISFLLSEPKPCVNQDECYHTNMGPQ